MTDNTENVLRNAGHYPTAAQPEPDSPIPARETLNGFALPEQVLGFSSRLGAQLSKTRTKGRRDAYDTLALQVDDTIINAINDKILKSLGVFASKLFDVSVAALTEKNAYNEPPSRLRVILDTAALARDLDSTDITPAGSSTAALAKKRNCDADNFIKKMKSTIDALSNEGTKYTWTETTRGAGKTYSGIQLLSANYIVNRKHTVIEFTQTGAEFFVHRPIGILPRAHFAIPNDRANAFAISRYLCSRYSIKNNVIKGTEGIVLIEKVLAVTSYPTGEQVTADRRKVKGGSHRTWVDRIKEPFENDLDLLVEIGVLTDWSYSHSGQRQLSDTETDGLLDSYVNYASHYLCYTVSGYPSHEERLAAIMAKKDASPADSKKLLKKGNGRKRKNGEKH